MRDGSEQGNDATSLVGRNRDVVYAILSALAGMGVGWWGALRTNVLLGTSIGACVFIYAFALYRCYVPPESGASTGSQSEDLE